MRWLFLLAGIAIGFALGYGLRETEPARAQRRSAAEPDARIASPNRTERQAPVETAPRPKPRVAAEPKGRIPEDEVVDPSWGRVVVDFRNSELDAAATIAGRDIFGQPDSEESDAGDARIIEFEVRAGRHLVWWKGGNGERVGAWVRVAGGRITDLLVGKGTPLPIPEGLGRIEVFVTALAGGPQSGADVQLEGDGDIWSEGVSAWTTATGRCQFEIMPGTYKLTVGARIMEAIVEVGATRSVEFRHEQEGDLLIRNAPDLTSFEITRKNEDPEADDETYGGGALFVYMKPGRYTINANLHANGGDYRDLGTVQILPKQRVEIDARLPPGGLRVEIVPRGGKRYGTAVVQLTATAETMLPAELRVGADSVDASDGSESWSTEFVALSRGVYALEVSCEGWKPVKRMVTVDRKIEEVAIELTR